MTKKIWALIMATMLLLSIAMTSALAVCPHSDFKIYYSNQRVCEKGCGFLWLYKQNVWDERMVYTCIQGGTEEVFNYNVTNGTCCY